MAELISRDSVRVRPKNVSWRKLMGLASRCTQSSRIEAGLQGGGEGVAGVDAAVEVLYDCTLSEAGRRRIWKGSLVATLPGDNMMFVLAISWTEGLFQDCRLELLKGRDGHATTAIFNAVDTG